MKPRSTSIQKLFYITTIKDGQLVKIFNVTEGRPSLSFKEIKNVIDYEANTIPVPLAYRSIHEVVGLNMVMSEEDIVNDSCIESNKSDHELDDIVSGGVTLKQLKRKCKVRKRKVPRLADKEKKQECGGANPEKDDLDFEETLGSLKRKFSGKIKSRKRPKCGSPPKTTDVLECEVASTNEKSLQVGGGNKEDVYEMTSNGKASGEMQVIVEIRTEEEDSLIIMEDDAITNVLTCNESPDILFSVCNESAWNDNCKTNSLENERQMPHSISLVPDERALQLVESSSNGGVSPTMDGNKEAIISGALCTSTNGPNSGLDATTSLELDPMDDTNKVLRPFVSEKAECFELKHHPERLLSAPETNSPDSQQKLCRAMNSNDLTDYQEIEKCSLPQEVASSEHGMISKGKTVGEMQVTGENCTEEEVSSIVMEDDAITDVMTCNESPDILLPVCNVSAWNDNCKTDSIENKRQMPHSMSYVPDECALQSVVSSSNGGACLAIDGNKEVIVSGSQCTSTNGPSGINATARLELDSMDDTDKVLRPFEKVECFELKHHPEQLLSALKLPFQTSSPDSQQKLCRAMNSNDLTDYQKIEKCSLPQEVASSEHEMISKGKAVGEMQVTGEICTEEEDSSIVMEDNAIADVLTCNESPDIVFRLCNESAWNDNCKTYSLESKKQMPHSVSSVPDEHTLQPVESSSNGGACSAMDGNKEVIISGALCTSTNAPTSVLNATISLELDPIDDTDKVLRPFVSEKADCFELKHHPELLLSAQKTNSPDSQQKLCRAMNSIHSTEYQKIEKSDQKQETNTNTRANTGKDQVLTSPIVVERSSADDNSPNSKETTSKGKEDKKLARAKGVYKFPSPTRCRLSSACSCIHGCSKNIIDFSQRQMKGTDRLAVNLTKELRSLKELMIEMLLPQTRRASTSRYCMDEVRVAIEKATKVEDMTRRCLTTMARDCNRFCKVVSLVTKSAAPSVRNRPDKEDAKNETEAGQEEGAGRDDAIRPRKKIKFADETGGSLCSVRFIEDQDSPNDNQPHQSE